MFLLTEKGHIQNNALWPNKRPQLLHLYDEQIMSKLASALPRESKKYESYWQNDNQIL